ncbi:DUF1289 domain-containing protein [Sphingomonas glacialis]|uniref:DUF1289 domain-containing protein n=1 Tax=Sphingomonas glacialis TaxID=658225 RepID=UPI00167810B8|nr:DUF1289 domain-containing protein [Sphingomonas glacialis]
MRSPCVELCGFDARTGWCQGCGRTREEVRRWRNLRPGDARRVASDLPQRLAKLSTRLAKDGAR